MDVFLFLSNKDHQAFALTDDKEGANLPKNRAPWEVKGSPINKTAELVRFGATREIIRSITTTGCYVAKRVPGGRAAGR